MSGRLLTRNSYSKHIERQLRTQYVDGIYSNSVTLKSRLWVAQGHWKWHHSIDRIGNDFLLALHGNYGVILYRLRDIASYRSKIAKFLYLTCISAPGRGVHVGISRRCLILIKLKWLGYRVVKKLWQKLLHALDVLYFLKFLSKIQLCFFFKNSI